MPVKPKSNSLGELFGIEDPNKQVHRVQKFLGPFTEVNDAVLLGVEIEWELLNPDDDLSSVVDTLRLRQPGLTAERIVAHFPQHRMDLTSQDHMGKLRAAFSSGLIGYHEEASLVHGLEMVLGPANPRVMKLLVDSMMVSGRDSCHATERCSTHVHMNVCDLDLDQMNSMTLIYPFVEELLFKWVDPMRWHNPFTRPWCTDAVIKAEPRKYQAMNILPSGCRLEEPFGEAVLSDMGRRILGTVEFRHFPGLTAHNLELFFRWLDFLVEFRSVAMTYSRDSLIEMFRPLTSTSGYVEVLRQLFPLTSVHWLRKFTHNDVQAFMDGAVAAFRLTLGKRCDDATYQTAFNLRAFEKSPYARWLIDRTNERKKRRQSVLQPADPFAEPVRPSSLSNDELHAMISQLRERVVVPTVNVPVQDRDDPRQAPPVRTATTVTPTRRRR